MNVFTPHFEILPEFQRALWESLRPCSRLGFTLYGGTAIALQLGHRSSIDFDFFSDAPLDARKEKELLAELPFLAASRVLQMDHNTRTYLTDRDVKISFFGQIGFGRVGTPKLTDDMVLQVASLDDLMATKLAVILQRVESKDYKDVAAMLRQDMTLARGLGSASALYGTQFPPSESVKALVYFHGGDMDQLSLADRNILLAATKELQLENMPVIPIVSHTLTLANERVDEQDMPVPVFPKKRHRM